MRVLVTGGAGYIGSATVMALKDRGHEVWVFDNLENGHRDAVPEGVEFIRGDLRMELPILRAMKCEPDAVIHFAAYAYVGESMKHPEKYYENNVIGTRNLLRAIKSQASVKKLVFSSSCATYGTPETLPITEDMPQLPENPYGQTKLDCENMIRWVSDTVPDFTYTFLRYFNAAGGLPMDGLGEQHDPETHLIPLVLEAVAGNRPYLKVFGHDYDTPDGTCIRDYVHIADLASAHVLALETTDNDYFNLGTGRGYSIMEVIKCVEEVTGTKVPYCIEPRRPGDPASLYADNQKAVNNLKWEPRHSSLKNIIETAWEWYTEGTPFLK